jgi:hypothetical protein
MREATQSTFEREMVIEIRVFQYSLAESINI